MRTTNNESRASKIELLICFAFLNVRAANAHTHTARRPTSMPNARILLYLFPTRRKKEFAHFRHAHMPEPVHTASISDASNKTTEKKKENNIVFVLSAMLSILWVISVTYTRKWSPFPRHDRLDAILHLLIWTNFSTRHTFIFTLQLLCISSLVGDSGGSGGSGSHSTYSPYYSQFGISFGFFSFLFVASAAHVVHSKNVLHIFVVASFEMEYFMTCCLP